MFFLEIETCTKGEAVDFVWHLCSLLLPEKVEWHIQYNSFRDLAFNWRRFLSTWVCFHGYFFTNLHIIIDHLVRSVMPTRTFVVTLSSMYPLEVHYHENIWRTNGKTENMVPVADFGCIYGTCHIFAWKGVWPILGKLFSTGRTLAYVRENILNS